MDLDSLCQETFVPLEERRTFRQELNVRSKELGARLLVLQAVLHCGRAVCCLFIQSKTHLGEFINLRRLCSRAAHIVRVVPVALEY